jgi:hypothetical protein
MMAKNNRLKKGRAVYDTKEHKDNSRKVEVIPGNTGPLTVQFLAEILKVLQEIRDGGSK